MLIIGLDPGLSCTGWGVIAAEGNRLAYVANGQIRTDAKAPLSARLLDLHDRLAAVIRQHRPEGAAVEEMFVNDNPQSTLKLHAMVARLLPGAKIAGADAADALAVAITHAHHLASSRRGFAA